MYAISLEKRNEAVPWGLANSTNPGLGPDAILQPLGNRQPKCWRELQRSSPHFHFTRPQSETACLSLYAQACIQMETRNPSLLTQCSVLFQFFVLSVHRQRITEQCHPKSFLFTICVLGRIYLEYVVQFITN